MIRTMVVVCIGLVSVSARADDFGDFQRAQRAYEAQDYPLSVERFEVLVGGESPRLESAPLILESRKYLAASYLLIGRRQAAEEQFEALLREDPDYALEPGFLREAIDLFDEVRVRLRRQAQEQEQARRARETTRRQFEADQRRRRERQTRRLVSLASHETVERVNSRWLAALPFGIGQFRNDHRRLGLFFAIAEASLLGISITTFALHESLRDENPSNPAVVNTATGLRITNWASNLTLLSVALVGVIDAQVRFRPVIRTVRERALPDDARPLEPPRPQLGLSISPTRVALSLRF